MIDLDLDSIEARYHRGPMPELWADIPALIAAVRERNKRIAGLEDVLVDISEYEGEPHEFRYKARMALVEQPVDPRDQRIAELEAEVNFLKNRKAD